MVSPFKIAIAATLAAGALGAQPAEAATLINVQFAGALLGPAPAQTGAALVGANGDAWNRLVGSSGTALLTDSRGAATGVTLTFSALGAYTSMPGTSAFAGTATANLMQGYLYSTVAPISAVFSGLAAGQAYTLYAFTQGDNATTGRVNALSVNGVAKTTTNSGRGTFAAGDNFALFSGTADAQGRIVVADAVARGEADLNGFQLSIGSAVPVPEAATWAMLIAGFALVGAAMRRRTGGVARTLA